jgi:tRNA (Thr-GGU) A37 N-methylase
VARKSKITSFARPRRRVTGEQRARENPLGLHRVTVREIVGNRIRIGPMEAMDGTPVVDIKPVLTESTDS